MLKAAAGARAQSPTLAEGGEASLDPEKEGILESIHREERPAWVSVPAQERYEQDW
jgi:hypothetical protein